MSAAAISRLETFTDWVNASVEARALALRPCLDHIRGLEPDIQAWVQVSPQPAGSGRLAAIPFGAKDSLETRGLSTEYGSRLYKGRVGEADAAVVRQLRDEGAILLGKTQTAAFAYRTPAPTRNPRNLVHTPGGSSSGSAAAVAAGMVPFAIGTQTKGSVLRPASYCGVTGFKASYGLLPMEGVLPMSVSLDTLGFFTHTPADMLALWGAIGYAVGEPEELVFGVPEPLPEVEPAMTAGFRNALALLRSAGVRIQPIDITGILAQLVIAGETVMFFEGARVHRQRFEEHGSRLDDLADLVRDGLQISRGRYEEAMGYIAECKVRMTEVFRTTPVVLVPAATGPAPRGLAFTGDAAMNTPWTALGTPALSIPMPVREGLPLGLQLTAGHGQDARVLRAAEGLHSIFTTPRS